MNAPQQATPTTLASFADRLLAARLRAGLTQDELAETIGVSQQSVAKWEGGLAVPRYHHRGALAHALCVSLDDSTFQELSIAAPSAATELLMAELIIVTMLGALTAEQKAMVAAQLEAAGVVGADMIRSQERRAAIVAGSAA